jgi:four helix bundle protein
MPELQHAKSFRDLIVHQKARKIAHTIFQLSKSFPRDETYSLTDQIRRVSRAIGVQIAEAWGKRPYERHFVSELTDADAEQLETQHWTDVAFDCGYLTQPQHAQLLDSLSEIGKMLHSMIAKASQFCGPPRSTDD